MPRERVGAGDALLVVDVQNDFLPGGALGVRDGDGVIQPLNALIERFRRARLPIYTCRDWHPPDHCSFRPVAVAGTAWPGPGRRVRAGTRSHPTRGARRRPSRVATLLRLRRHRPGGAPARGGVRRLFIGGLATDYCVRWTVQDALALGLDAVVVRDAVRAVDVRPGDGARALRAIRARGARTLPRAALVA
jgi:nicotinamidase/pyrazinamidase